MSPTVAVLGAINVDLVVRAASLPGPGVTVTGGAFSRHHGGKGGNQAVAAARALGPHGRVVMLGCVGEDDLGREALRALVEEGVDVSGVATSHEEPTGVALIMVDDTGENQIAVAPGANLRVEPTVVRAALEDTRPDLVLLSLEAAPEAALAAAERSRAAGVPLLLNPAPVQPWARELLDAARWLTPNEHELEELGSLPDGPMRKTSSSSTPSAERSSRPRSRSRSPARARGCRVARRSTRRWAERQLEDGARSCSSEAVYARRAIINTRRGRDMADLSTRERAARAFDEHDWQEAYESLSVLAEGGEAGPEDLERLGEAAWWSAHPAESIEAFERAYAAHETAGHTRAAALIALRLAMEHADRSETALWNAWMQRAIRLLGDEPDCVERGWLEVALVRSSLDRGDPEGAIQHAIAGHDLGIRFGDRDLQAFGLVLHGAILVHEADVATGISMVDEGTLAAVGGELTPFAAGSIYCITIGVCRNLADYRRAGQWTEAAKRWCERQSITGFPGICSVQRAEILRMGGAFEEAEAEARTAQTVLEAFGRLPQAGAGAEQVGEVRLRMGDLEGASEAFELAHQLGHEPQPGIAMLRLAQGQVDAAQASIGAALADTADPLERARLLPARVEIAIAAHDLTGAREASDELRAIASTFDAPMIDAASRQALGAVHTAEDEPTDAIAELRAAVRDWTEAEMPFETAQARCLLATAYRAAGDDASATLELRSARAIFERIGARLGVERCEALIRAGEERRSGRRVERTFMFTDIVGSTNLVESIGDEAWEDVLRWHDEALRSSIEGHGGEVVHTTGDGFFASFADVDAAATCAISIQRRLAEHRRKHGFAPRVRIGLHAAEATVIADDYAGVGVHEAARVAGLAEGDEILVTVSSLAGSATFAVSDEREVTLKGLARPVSVASIGWRV